MNEKDRVILGAGLGLVWSLALLIVAALFLKLPVFALIPTIMTAFLAPGLAMAVMIGRIAQRRYVEAQASQGPLSEVAEVDRRVLQNTTEQLVLAAAIWPAAAVLLGPYGPGVIMALGVGFALSRLVFWAGCHRSTTLRAAGFAATFYPTVLVALWALMSLFI